MANREDIMTKISELIGPFNNKGVDLAAETTFQGDLEWDKTRARHPFALS